jgi:hypothetical protein
MSNLGFLFSSGATKWHEGLSRKYKNERKRIKKIENIKAHPPESPLNGGMIQIKVREKFG